MLGRVSPKSRGRKVKGGGRGRRVRGNAAQASAGAATRPGAARRSPSSARSGFADALLDQLKVLGDPESVPSAFQAEVATSVVLGNMTEAGTKKGIEPETTRELLVEAIRHVVEGLERRTPPCAFPGAAGARGARAARGRRVRSRGRRGAGGGSRRAAGRGRQHGTSRRGSASVGRRPGTRYAQGMLRHRGRVRRDAHGAVRVQRPGRD